MEPDPHQHRLASARTSAVATAWPSPLRRIQTQHVPHRASGRAMVPTTPRPPSRTLRIPHWPMSRTTPRAPNSALCSLRKSSPRERPPCCPDAPGFKRTEAPGGGRFGFDGMSSDGPATRSRRGESGQFRLQAHTPAPETHDEFRRCSRNGAYRGTPQTWKRRSPVPPPTRSSGAHRTSIVDTGHRRGKGLRATAGPGCGWRLA